jgi:hypothetical protein
MKREDGDLTSTKRKRSCHVTQGHRAPRNTHESIPQDVLIVTRDAPLHPVDKDWLSFSDTARTAPQHSNGRSGSVSNSGCQTWPRTRLSNADPERSSAMKANPRASIACALVEHALTNILGSIVVRRGPSHYPKSLRLKMVSAHGHFSTLETTFQTLCPPST